MISGALLFLASGAALAVIVRVMGVILVVTAAVRLSILMRSYERGTYFAITLFNATLLLILGAIMIILPLVTLNLMLEAIGIYLIFSAITRGIGIMRSIRSESPIRPVVIVLTAVMLVLGIWLLFSPAEAERTAELPAGAALLIKGCETIASAIARNGGKKKTDGIEAEFIDRSES